MTEVYVKIAINKPCYIVKAGMKDMIDFDPDDPSILETGQYEIYDDDQYCPVVYSSYTGETYYFKRIY